MKNNVNKKTVIIIIVMVAVLVAAIAAVLIYNNMNSKELTPENGFTDPNTGIRYLSVSPMKLYPRTDYVYEEKPYLTVGNYSYYVVANQNPDNILAYKENDYWYLIRNEEMTEPNVYEFEPIAASVFNRGNSVQLLSFDADAEYIIESGDTVPEGHVGETYLLKQIADAFENDENINISFTEENIDKLYYIHMYSPKYPGLYYIISFVKSNGMYYLRDSSNNTTVKCPRDVAFRIMGNE